MALCLSSVAFISTAPAKAESIRWGGVVSPEAYYRVLGVPDFRTDGRNTYTVGNFKTDSRPGSFNPVRRYGRLATLDPSLSGVTFRRGYLVAFEGNGGHGAGVSQGWESAIWTFTDSRGSFVYRYNEKKTVAHNNLFNGASGVVASGPIDSSVYARFFGMCCSDGTGFMGYIIFNLRAMGIDPNDSAFQVNFQGWHEPDGSSGEGTPDPDAYGIIDSCPVTGVCGLP